MVLLHGVGYKQKYKRLRNLHVFVIASDLVGRLPYEADAMNRVPTARVRCLDNYPFAHTCMRVLAFSISISISSKG